MAKKRKTLKPAFPFYGREYSCQAKVQYPTHEAAESALLARDDGGRGTNPYRCPWCTGWHVGHGKGRRDTWKKKKRVDSVII
jgi:hypothetical protein